MLDGPTQEQWIDAFFKAFNYQEFYSLLFYRMNRQLTEYTSEKASTRTAISETIDALSRRDEETDLIARAVEARPRNPDLLRLAGERKAAAVPERSHLERLIKKSNSFLDIAEWLTKAGEMQVCVCRIEISADAGTVFGTGFLIGPDLVMTNAHVVECISAIEDGIAGYTGPRSTAAQVNCRFDYKVIDGVTNHGVRFQLASNWRAALSPDAADGLDCAVLRLAKAAGDLVVGDKPNAPGDPRGWIRLPEGTFKPPFTEHSPMFMIEHPEGEPLKLALETDSIQSVNANRTRVRYSTNSMEGSSGSPCFDQDWNLIALHHAGDPNFKAQYNEGIPIDAIVTFLRQKGIV